MTPNRKSLADQLLPDWMGGDGGDERAGEEGPHRRVLQRITQLRDGIRAAVPALPEEFGELGARAREVADDAASRARRLATAVGGESSGEPEAPLSAASGDRRGDAVEDMARVRSALQELHFEAVKLKVVSDRMPSAGDSDDGATGDDGAEELRRAVARAEEATRELEELLPRGEQEDGVS